MYVSWFTSCVHFSRHILIAKANIDYISDAGACPRACLTQINMPMHSIGRDWMYMLFMYVLGACLTCTTPALVGGSELQSFIAREKMDNL